MGSCIFENFFREAHKRHTLNPCPLIWTWLIIDLIFSRKCIFQNSLAFEMEHVVDYHCHTKRQCTMPHKFTQPRTEERECEKAGWKMAAQVCSWPNIWQIWGLAICFVFSWQETKLFNVTSFLKSETSDLSFCGHLLPLLSFYLNSIWLNPKEPKLKMILKDADDTNWTRVKGSQKTSIQNTQTGRESESCFILAFFIESESGETLKCGFNTCSISNLSKLSSLWSFYEPRAM